MIRIAGWFKVIIMRYVYTGLVCLLLGVPTLAQSTLAQSTTAPAPPTADGIVWQNWSDDVFVRAQKENKFVLLDLEAVWCHWCHVMDQNTYSDPRVIHLIQSKYIAVKVDQDSRPDLCSRYQGYGWPATVVFNAKGGEIVKRQGYLPPDLMASILQAIIDDPTPGPSIRAEETPTPPAAGALSPLLRQTLQARHVASYDQKMAGWGTVDKFLDWDSVEYATALANSDNREKQMALDTLAAERQIIDPVWGGVYQYSTDDDWVHPHFEKIMQMQAEDLRIYCLAYAAFGRGEDLQSAADIRRYLSTFLSGPDGAFYTSQDADLVDGQHSASYFALDDAGRRKLGIPRIDKHIYSRENGWAINALACDARFTGDDAALQQAIAAAQWIIGHRSLPDGGFRHDQTDPSGPYLADTLSMGRAMLQLYAATADRAWLSRAMSAAAFIRAHFVDASAVGVATSDLKSAVPLRPAPQLDENVVLARWANLLSYYTGRKEDRELAQTAMRYLAAPQISGRRGTLVAGILLADREIASEPIHLTVLGSKDDPTAKALFAMATAFPSGYVRVEWLDRNEGPLLNADVEYPKLNRPAAFVCTATSCSTPSFSVEMLKKTLERVKLAR
jgi:uncharacterized protein